MQGMHSNYTTAYNIAHVVSMNESLGVSNNFLLCYMVIANRLWIFLLTFLIDQWECKVHETESMSGRTLERYPKGNSVNDIDLLAS